MCANIHISFVLDFALDYWLIANMRAGSCMYPFTLKEVHSTPGGRKYPRKKAGKRPRLSALLHDKGLVCCAGSLHFECRDPVN